MSATLAATRSNVKRIIGDVTPSNPAAGDDQYDRAIEGNMHFIGNQVGMGQAWVTSAITLVSGTYDYTLPGSVEYAQILDLRLVSQGWMLTRVTLEQMELLRRGPAANQSQGDPTRYALWEDASQGVNVRLWQQPNKIDTIDLLRSVIPAVLSTETSSIPFSMSLLRVLERFAAVEIVSGMTDESLAIAKKTRGVISVWEKMAERMLVKEQERISRNKSVPYIASVER